MKQDKNKILNEKEENLLLDHDYDGIQEFDYPLPSWWVHTFVGGVFFAFVYIYLYEFADAPSLREEFASKMKVIQEIRENEAKNVNKFSHDQYQALVAKGDTSKSALVIFEENCLSCHEEGGRGGIGPNLTDDYWLNVKKVAPEDLYHVVVKGVEENGMPPWGEVLTKEEIMAVVSYVMKIAGTNIEGGKAPQGEKLVK